MFKKDLERRLKAIFGFKKITFDAPSESFEQDTMFVEIADCDTRPGKEKISARVTGRLTVFSANDRFTYGALTKRIEKAKPADKDPIFFYDVDTNVENSPARLVNISERRTSFVFLFSDQYDPNQGTMNELELTLEAT